MALLPRRVRHGERAELVVHLDELRRRLVISSAALALAFGVTFTFHERILGWLNAPLDGKDPITLGVAEPFTTSLTVSLYAAVALALPVFLWQAWAYLAPALDEERQRSVAPLVVVASLLLVGGMAFAYWVVLPSTIPFLLGFDDELYQTEVRARDYYAFAAFTVVGVGALFELPVFLLGLVRLGVLVSTRSRPSCRRSPCSSSWRRRSGWRRSPSDAEPPPHRSRDLLPRQKPERGGRAGHQESELLVARLRRRPQRSEIATCSRRSRASCRPSSIPDSMCASRCSLLWCCTRMVRVVRPSTSARLIVFSASASGMSS
jgi:sec-independent protein translocase protein TatC